MGGVVTARACPAWPLTPGLVSNSAPLPHHPLPTAGGGGTLDREPRGVGLACMAPSRPTPQLVMTAPHISHLWCLGHDCPGEGSPGA